MRKIGIALAVLGLVLFWATSVRFGHVCPWKSRRMRLRVCGANVRNVATAISMWDETHPDAPVRVLDEATWEGLMREGLLRELPREWGLTRPGYAREPTHGNYVLVPRFPVRVACRVHGIWNPDLETMVRVDPDRAERESWMSPAPPAEDAGGLGEALGFCICDPEQKGSLGLAALGLLLAAAAGMTGGAPPREDVPAG